MNDHELKALINKPINTGPLQEGDRVRVKSRDDVEDPDMDPYYIEEMEEYAGGIYTIESIYSPSSVILGGTSHYSWNADWLERV